MPNVRAEVLEFLLSRRSRPAKTLGDQAPARAELETLLTAASRTPDHGKLVPWRFVVLRDIGARTAIADMAARHLAADGVDDGAVEKARAMALYGGAVIAVVAAPKPSEKIPKWEQELAAGAVCLSLLNAALASGWGANWLTGPLARHAGFLAEAFGCTADEFVAGFIHLGNETVIPPERDRPDLHAITEWR